jgi:hypothetical protein
VNTTIPVHTSDSNCILVRDSYRAEGNNTLSYVNDNYEKLIDILEKESSVLIDWFKFNCMQANPDTFQAIAVGNKTHAKTPVFKIDSAEITCDEVVKLLGIDIDYQLNFNYHINNICFYCKNATPKDKN